MIVLVTGGTGYLGRHVARAVAALGHEPVLFARRAGAAGLPWRAVEGDVTDRESLVAAARGCDAICHVAAKVEIVGRPADFDAVNVGGLRHAIAAVEAHGLSRLVYTSSFLASPPADAPALRATNDYQRTKAAAAHVAREAARRGVPIVIVAPGVVYGPGSWTEGNLAGRLLRDYMGGRLPATVGARRTWSFSYVEDVAAGHAAALQRGDVGECYGLGGPNLPQAAMYEWVRSRRGGRLPLDLPLPIARAAGALDAWRARVFGGTPSMTPGAVEILAHDWPVDSGRAVRDLGYAMTPFEDGVAATVADIERDLARR